MSILTLLIEIQENKKIIGECENIIKDSSYVSELKRAKKQFDMEKCKFKCMEKELEDIREKYKNINSDINENKKELEENKFQLYNSAGSDLKLIDILQKKIEKEQENVKSQDNETLELLEKEEKLSLEKESLRLKLSKLKYDFYICKESGNKKLAEAKESLEKSQNKIQKIEKLIPEDILKTFNNICSFKDVGAAQIQNGICLGCKVKVSSMTIDGVNRGERIVYCDNCGRIVYCNENKKN